MNTKIWKPHPGRQEEFLSLPDTIQEALYGGALGGGKTMILLMLPIARAFYQHPRFQGIVFRRTFPEVEENLIPKSKEWYPLVGGKYNDTKHAWYFPSGSVIRFGYLDNDDDVRKHDGSEYSYIAYDELEHFTEYMYLQLHARNRSPIRELPKIIRCTAMPGGIGHSWVRNRFVEPFIQGGKILKDKVTGNKRIFIPAKLTDNPSLTDDDPDYINKLRNLPLAEQKAKIDGDWWAFLGQVFPEFRLNRYPDEPPNALHVIEPFEIPTWWPRIASVDWGYDAATAIYKAAISPDRRVFIYYEYVRRNEYISTWASNFRRESPEKFRTIALDPSAWHQRGDEKTVAEQFMEHSGFLVERADNDRVGGRMLFHEFLRWKERPKKYIPPEGYNEETAQRIHRYYGTDALNDYRSLFLPEPDETNTPIFLPYPLTFCI